MKELGGPPAGLLRGSRKVLGTILILRKEGDS